MGGVLTSMTGGSASPSHAHARARPRVSRRGYVAFFRFSFALYGVGGMSLISFSLSLISWDQPRRRLSSSARVSDGADYRG